LVGVAAFAVQDNALDLDWKIVRGETLVGQDHFHTSHQLR
jgi:hypothetical protein